LCAPEPNTKNQAAARCAANFFVPWRDGNLVPNGRSSPRLVAVRERLARTSWSRAHPGERGTPFSGWSKAKSALDTASGVSGWWLHDLRRTLANRAAAPRRAPRSHRGGVEPSERKPMGPARPLQSRLFIRGRDLQSAFLPAAIVTLSNRIRPAFRRRGARSNGKARNGC
jgi:hypothetical protein